MKRKPGRPRGNPMRSAAIADALTQLIASRQWALASRVPSRRELAKRLNVGATTVRRALDILKQRGLVHADAAGRLRVSAGASFESTFAGAIAIVVTRDLWSLQESAHGPGAIWRGILERTRSTGQSLVVLQDFRWRTECPVGLAALPLRGVLLIAGVFSETLLGQYAGLNIPVVVLDQPALGQKVHSVAVASYKSAFDATRRIISAGHQRIALVRPFLAGRGRPLIDPDTLSRTKGFIDACEEGGLDASDYRVFTVSYTHRDTPGVQEVLRASPPFTAALAMSPIFAANLEAAARKRGLHIPRDLSIVAYRSIAESRDWTGPLIDFSVFGRKGVDLILNPPSNFNEVLVTPEWHEGDSLSKRR